MRKMVFMFPGVGSQYIGMGQQFYKKYRIARETFEEAGDILKIDLAKTCFSPEKKQELQGLEISQCALLAVSMATYRVYMQEIGVIPLYCMGHSLGEYSALCCAGVIEFPDALQLVKQRGMIIKRISSTLEGTMMWVINLDTKVVESVCKALSNQGETVFISAYDSPTQLSISGSTNSVMKAAKRLEKEGAIVYPLNVNGPYHSPLMMKAAEEMKEVVKQYRYKEPTCQVIANYNALPYPGAAGVMENLSLQLISPVRWRASIEYLLKQGAEIAVEMGPKNVLKFLVKKITDAIEIYTLDNESDLDNLKRNLIIGKKELLSLVGRCLGVATSTRNRNDNHEDYKKKVIKPYRVMESIYNEIKANGKYPTGRQVNEVMKMLSFMLKGKNVPPEEQDFWIARALGGKMLAPGERPNREEE